MTFAEIYGRNAVQGSSRVSNPGCYATNMQLLLAPLIPHLDPMQSPTVFGVSGYSGAGTRSGEKDADGLPKTVPKIVSRSRGFRGFPWCVGSFP